MTDLGSYAVKGNVFAVDSSGHSGGAPLRIISCLNPSMWPSSCRSTPTLSKSVVKYDGSISNLLRLGGSVGKNEAAMGGSLSGSFWLKSKNLVAKITPGGFGVIGLPSSSRLYSN